MRNPLLPELRRSEATLTAAEVRQRLARLARVQEEDRYRIAREIHEQMGQQVTALRMALDTIQRDLSSGANVASMMARAARLADDLDHSIDVLTWSFRPVGLDHSDLPAALRDLVRTWTEQAGIPAECECVGEGVTLPFDITANLYRIAQEALHNISRHAGASHARVMIEVRKPSVLLTIEDDGRGFTPPALSGVGLIGMRERASLAGGALQLESAPGRGTSIFVRIPLALDALEDRLPDVAP